MNDYITLDGYKYRTNSKNWKPPLPVKPMTIRIMLTGTLDVTYGNGTMLVWSGEIIAPVSPSGTGWGTYATLQATALKRYSIGLTDHNGASFPAVHLSVSDWRSLLPQWDAPSNEMYASVRISGATT